MTKMGNERGSIHASQPGTVEGSATNASPPWVVPDGGLADVVRRFPSKLREASVLRFDQVRAVVVETTGDVSVLHVGTEDRGSLDKEILDGVRGVDRIGFEADGSVADPDTGQGRAR